MSLVNSYIYEGDEYVPSSANDYAFSSWTFTNLGAIGRNGPLNTAKYSGFPWPDTSTYFSISSGVQSWRVPATATYKLTVAGASNKYSVTDTRTGTPAIVQTRGGIVSLLVNLTRGDVLNLVVGQPGTSTSVTGTGGAGGTFILSSTGNPILVAGGAGGLNGSSGNDPANCSASSSLTNFDAPAVTPGWAGSYTGTGGTAGSGGTGGGGYSGGGAGLTSAGTIAGTGGGSQWIGGFIPNGTSLSNVVQVNQDQGNGGFGGGGAAGYTTAGGAGGGGGYSGGAGGNTSTHGTGGANYYMAPSSSAVFEGYNDVDTSLYPGTSSKTFGYGYITIAVNTPSYTFTNWTFTNMSTSGPTGPVTGSTYSGSSFVGFSVTNGIQSWTVPKFGTYYIAAAGASGGPSDYESGGRGRVVTTSIVLQAGTVLKILVGQQGKKGTNNGGGGGGTFVAFSSNNSPIIVAGGGGGAQRYNDGSTQSGDDAVLTPGNGQGATLSWYGTDAGSPGAGFYSDNGFSGSFVGSSAKGFINGGATVNNGGFGGGGSFTSTNSGGGGGGYSGGQGGTDGIYSRPQGGTCYDWASEVPVSTGFNIGHGFVTIVATDTTYDGIFDPWYRNTQLLLHSNPSLDASAYSRTLTPTNVTSSSVQYRVGSSSMYFDGTSNIIASTVSTMNTIEFWVYLTATPTSSTTFAASNNWTLKPSDGFSTIGLSWNANTAWRTGQWYHVAYTRDGNTHRLYRDGILNASMSNTRTYTYTSVIFGANLTGYMSEIRITDFARYVSNNFSLQTLQYYPLITAITLNLPSTPIVQYTADSIGQSDNSILVTWNGLTASGSPLVRRIGGFSYIQFDGTNYIPVQNLPAQQMCKFGSNGGGTFIYFFCLSAIPTSDNETNSILNFIAQSPPVQNTNYTTVNYQTLVNSWSLLIINVSGTNYSVYINNSLVNSGTLTYSIVNSLTSTIGFDLGVSAPMKHHGLVVYDRSLTTNEMTQIYNSVSSVVGTNI